MQITEKNRLYVWISILVVITIVTGITLHFVVFSDFNIEEKNDFPNWLTLLIEIMLGIGIALIIYDHAKKIEEYLGGKVFDTIVVNSSDIPQEVLDYNKKLNKERVENLGQDGYAVLNRELTLEQIVQPVQGDQIKRSRLAYDPQAVRAVVNKILPL